MLALLPYLIQLTSLEQVEKSVSEASKKSPLDYAALQKANLDIAQILEQNKLSTGDEFMRAQKAFSLMQMRFDRARVRHELTLAALASGNQDARAEIKKVWDQFLVSVGRAQRVGTMTFSKEPMFRIERAPKSVFNVLNDPDEAVKRASQAKDDDEVTKVCDDDQKDRQSDWSKLTPLQMGEINKRDKARLARIYKLLESGRVVTAQDFAHASLVLQHGSYWNDYCLAHELSICGLLLGDKKSAWLTAATYDRMLQSGGYHQRFGTQYSSMGNLPFKLDPVDTDAIGDAERKAMHCPTLEEAKNRKWD